MNHLGKMRAARRRKRSLGALRARCLEALERRYALAGDLGTAEAPAEEVSVGDDVVTFVKFDFVAADFVEGEVIEGEFVEGDDSAEGYPGEDFVAEWGEVDVKFFEAYSSEEFGELKSLAVDEYERTDFAAEGYQLRTLAFDTFAFEPLTPDAVEFAYLSSEEMDPESLAASSFGIMTFRGEEGDFEEFAGEEYVFEEFVFEEYEGEVYAFDEVAVEEGEEKSDELDDDSPILYMTFGSAAGETVYNWRNSVEPTDVNNDGVTAPLDVLLIINELNLVGSRDLTSSVHAAAAFDSGEPFYYLDVNGDNHCSPVDAHIILTLLNAPEVDAPSAFAPVTEQAELAAYDEAFDARMSDESWSDVEGENSEWSAESTFAARIRLDDYSLVESDEAHDVSDAKLGSDAIWADTQWDESLVEVTDEWSDEFALEEELEEEVV